MGVAGKNSRPPERNFVDKLKGHLEGGGWEVYLVGPKL